MASPHTHDIIVAGAEWGRVRALISDTGAQIKEAAPSLPVEVLGFNGTPEAGDRVAVVESEARAREITDYRTAEMINLDVPEKNVRFLSHAPTFAQEEMIGRLMALTPDADAA